MGSIPYKRNVAFSSFTPIGNHVGTTDLEKKRMKTYIIACFVIVLILLLIVVLYFKMNFNGNSIPKDQDLPQEVEMFQ